MNKFLPFAFLINLFAFSQQEIPFSNKKDEFVKVVPYSDGSYSIVTSESINWGKTTSRVYNEKNELINTFSLPPKTGISCSIHGRNNLQFPDMTVYHPELKYTVMLGGVSGPLLPPQMVCRIVDETGKVVDIPFKFFKETKHSLVDCQIQNDKLLVMFCSKRSFTTNEYWLAVIDLKYHLIREKEVVRKSKEKLLSYIGFSKGKFHFLSSVENKALLHQIDVESNEEQISIDFPESLLSIPRRKLVSGYHIEEIHPVSCYNDKQEGEICFILYGPESFICKLSSNNEITYQPLIIPDLLLIVLISDRGLEDFRKAVIIDTKDGVELLMSNPLYKSVPGASVLGRWQIQWDYAEKIEPVDFHTDVLLGTPLDMIAYSGMNPGYEEWKEAQGDKTGVLSLRTLEDFQGTFSFIEFSSKEGNIPTHAILYK